MNAARRSAQAALVALALVGLLVLVAMGARAGHPFGHARLRQREVPARVGNDLFTLTVILYAVGSAIVVAAFFTLRRENWRKPETDWIRNLISSIAILIAFSFLAYEIGRAVHHRRAHTPLQHVRGYRGSRGPLTLPNRPAPKQPAHFDWEFAAALGGLALLVAAYLTIRSRREEEPAPSAQGAALEDVFAQVVRETIDDLRGEVEPRRAVIAAYARMEGILARHGYGRRRSETPHEYLERVLRELRVAPAAVHELTDLFEVAKFSTHSIGEELRERALAAFLSIRDDVAAVPA